MRHYLVWATGLLLATACHQSAPETAPTPDADRAAALAGRPPGANLSPDHDGALYFDLRYLDSVDTEPKASWSARTRREMAIGQQLTRLRLAKRPSTGTVIYPGEDSTWEKPSDGPLKGYPSEDAWRADIYRKIDSLKVLEHLHVTPH
ncbi:hypothetical protein [Hymenobacter terrenus]|uniref:hypothetical protein n=1 Tax=Hymenobacter terrenus TaxID=1629124 RepID=UPI000619958E|nr:hypothetical protein [Hymenobacter terrenus]